MYLHPSIRSAPSPAPNRLLLVADWTVDPRVVVDAVNVGRDASAFGLVVPARLHGLDWAGDPRASCPCAQRQLEAIQRLAATTGIQFGLARVGDPDPLAAIGDALADWSAQGLLICERRRRFGLPVPFDLASRAWRQTGLAVERLTVPAARTGVARRPWFRLGRGHCDVRLGRPPALTDQPTVS